MPRAKRSPAQRASEAGRPGIHPTAVYTQEEAALVLHVGRDTFRREVRAGRIRPAPVARKNLYLGQTLLDWLQARMT